MGRVLLIITIYSFFTTTPSFDCDILLLKQSLERSAKEGIWRSNDLFSLFSFISFLSLPLWLAFSLLELKCWLWRLRFAWEQPVWNELVWILRAKLGNARRRFWWFDVRAVTWSRNPKHRWNSYGRKLEEAELSQYLQRKQQRALGPARLAFVSHVELIRKELTVFSDILWTGHRQAKLKLRSLHLASRLTALLDSN